MRKKTIKICDSVKRYYNAFADYLKFTKNINFLIRLLILRFLIFLKSIFPIFERIYIFTAKKLKKRFLFTTPFGTFLCSTANQRYVMKKNYEEDIREYVFKNIKKNEHNNKNVFINIGSHIGRRWIELAKNHNYDVIAFEPSPDTYYSLKCNIALSDVEDKFETYNYWLWNFEWNIQFEYFDYHDGWSHVINWNYVSSWKWKLIKIPIKVFDNIHISKEKINNTRLIIMDVEWYELEVLLWMKSTLQEFRDIDIIMEIFDDNKYKEKTIDLMEQLWYNIKRIGPTDWIFSK